MKLGLDTMREELAALAHDQWAGWMRYLFDMARDNADGSVTIPSKLVARWRRQMSTYYVNLPPHERNSDLVEADRVLAVLSRYLKFQTEQAQETEAQDATQERLQQGDNQPEHS